MRGWSPRVAGGSLLLLLVALVVLVVVWQRCARMVAAGRRGAGSTCNSLGRVYADGRRGSRGLESSRVMSCRVALCRVASGGVAACRVA